MTPKLKPWQINLCLCIFSAIVSLIILEAILRCIEYKDVPVFSAEYRHYFKKDPEAGYDIRENFPKTTARIENTYYYQYWSNELGCFDKPYHGEKDYILLLGDSFTHMFAPYEDKWGTILENLLTTRVLKCGVVGYGTRQEYIKAKKIISQVKTSPKLIVLGYFINDFTDDYVFPNMTVLNGFLVYNSQLVDIKRGLTKEKDKPALEKEITDVLEKQETEKRRERILPEWLTRKPLLYKRLSKLWEGGMKKYPVPQEQQKSIRTNDSSDIPPGVWIGGFLTLPEKEYTWLEKGWEIHYKNLAAVKKLALDCDARLLVVIIPTKEQIYFPNQLREIDVDFDPPLSRLRQFLAKEKISFLDLTPLFLKYARKKQLEFLDPERDLYWRIDGHWSKKGNRLAGLLVADYIVENNLCRVADRGRTLQQIKEQLKNFN